MRILRLDIARLRRFERVELAPGPGLNLLVGDNGAGKTSVLEAIHLLGYGRSFRGRVRDGLVQQGAERREWQVPKQASGRAALLWRRRLLQLRLRPRPWPSPRRLCAPQPNGHPPLPLPLDGSCGSNYSASRAVRDRGVVP